MPDVRLAPTDAVTPPRMHRRDDRRGRPVSLTLQREPIRIQRRRVKGWRMPEGTVYVGRPGKYGSHIRITPERGVRGRVTMYRVHGSPMDINGGPAYVGLDTARQFAASFFEWDLLNGRIPNYPSLAQIRDELAGRDLACWCPPRQVHRNGSLGRYCCHADVLLDIAQGYGSLDG